MKWDFIFSPIQLLRWNWNAPRGGHRHPKKEKATPPCFRSDSACLVPFTKKTDRMKLIFIFRVEVEIIKTTSISIYKYETEWKEICPKHYFIYLFKIENWLFLVTMIIFIWRAANESESKRENGNNDLLLCWWFCWSSSFYHFFFEFVNSVFVLFRKNVFVIVNV